MAFAAWFAIIGKPFVFALEAGIPFDVEQACDIVLHGTPQPVCLGLAGETRFLLMAGAGFDADVVYRVSGRLKRWTGKLRSPEWLAVKYRDRHAGVFKCDSQADKNDIDWVKDRQGDLMK